MPGKAAKITLTERHQELLQFMTRQPTCDQGLVRRARIILLAFDGLDNAAIAAQLQLERHAVGLWRRRWAKAFSQLASIECCETAASLRHAVEVVLSDQPRSGNPGKFTPEQVTQILAVACERPEGCARPVTRWTPRELADEVSKRGIVDSISPRHLGRFLKYRRPATASSPLLVERPPG